MKVDAAQMVAIVGLPVMLGVAGLGTFFWMAGTGWSDMTGVGVGIIYVALTVIQIVFTVAWWRVMKKQPEEDLTPEPVELKSVSPGRRVSGDRMANAGEKGTDSPLLHRAGSNGKVEQATA